MVKLDLHLVDELIRVRERTHGGKRGAPRVMAGKRVGQSLNRSCVVMISALLQSFIEEVYFECSVELLPRLKNQDNVKEFKNTSGRLGNPSPDNIKRLFLGLGHKNILNGLSWQRCEYNRIVKILKEINEIRNAIAHGKESLTLNGKPYSLRLERIRVYREFVYVFSNRFPDHARKQIK